MRTGDAARWQTAASCHSLRNEAITRDTELSGWQMRSRGSPSVEDLLHLSDSGPSGDLQSPTPAGQFATGNWASDQKPPTETDNLRRTKTVPNLRAVGRGQGPMPAPVVTNGGRTAAVSEDLQAMVDRHLGGDGSDEGGAGNSGFKRRGSLEFSSSHASGPASEWLSAPGSGSSVVPVPPGGEHGASASGGDHDGAEQPNKKGKTDAPEIGSV